MTSPQPGEAKFCEGWACEHIYEADCEPSCHAPSPLPREALDKAIFYTDPTGAKVFRWADDRVVVGEDSFILGLPDAILAAGFRRSVVSTPSEDVRALIEESLTRNHVGERVSAQPEAYRQRIAEVISDRLSAVSAPPTITDEMAEGMARMLHAQSAEGRSGFSWPVNGEWGRQRDLEAARIVLNYVFTFVSKCAGCHATVTTVNPDPRHEDGCVVAARAALGGEGGTQ